jgi:hypothetical protein
MKSLIISKPTEKIRRKKKEKGRKVWKISEFGLSLHKETNKRMNNDSSQRLSPQGDGREDEVGGLLAAASDFARSVLDSVQALAGTTACKGVQIATYVRGQVSTFLVASKLLNSNKIV